MERRSKCTRRRGFVDSEPSLRFTERSPSVRFVGPKKQARRRVRVAPGAAFNDPEASALPLSEMGEAGFFCSVNGSL